MNYGNWDIFAPAVEAYQRGQLFAQQREQNRLILQQQQQQMQQQQDYQNALARMYNPVTRTVQDRNAAYMTPNALAETIDPMAKAQAEWQTQKDMETYKLQPSDPAYMDEYRKRQAQVLPDIRAQLQKDAEEAGYTKEFIGQPRTEVVPFKPTSYAEVQAMQDYAKQMQAVYEPALSLFSERKNVEGVRKIADIYKQSGNPMLMQMGEMLSTYTPQKEGYTYIQNPITDLADAQRFLDQNPSAKRFYPTVNDVPLGQYLNVIVGDDENIKKIGFEKMGSEAKQEAISREFQATPKGMAALRSLIDPSDKEAFAQLDALSPVAGMTLTAKKDPKTGKTSITIGGATKEGRGGDDLTPAQKAVQARSDRAFGAQLRERFESNPIYKNYQTLVGQYNIIKSMIQTMPVAETLNPTDQAIITTFNKILDPGSVVRESEYARTPENMALLDRAYAFTSRLAQGGVLDNTERTSIMQAVDVIKKAQDEQYMKFARKYRRAAEVEGLDPDLVVSPEEIPTKSAVPTKKGQTRTIGGYTVTVED